MKAYHFNYNGELMRKSQLFVLFYVMFFSFNIFSNEIDEGFNCMPLHQNKDISQFSINAPGNPDSDQFTTLYIKNDDISPDEVYFYCSKIPLGSSVLYLCQNDRNKLSLKLIAIIDDEIWHLHFMDLPPSQLRCSLNSTF